MNWNWIGISWWKSKLTRRFFTKSAATSHFKGQLHLFISFNFNRKNELDTVVWAVDVLVLGFANLVADVISMGFGDFVSSSTKRDMAAKDRAVTKWDVDNRCRHQLTKLLHKYQTLGISAMDASTVKPLVRVTAWASEGKKKKKNK